MLYRDIGSDVQQTDQVAAEQQNRPPDLRRSSDNQRDVGTQTSVLSQDAEEERDLGQQVVLGFAANGDLDDRESELYREDLNRRLAV